VPRQQACSIEVEDNRLDLHAFVLGGILALQIAVVPPFSQQIAFEPRA